MFPTRGFPAASRCTYVYLHTHPRLQFFSPPGSRTSLYKYSTIFLFVLLFLILDNNSYPQFLLTILANNSHQQFLPTILVNNSCQQFLSMSTLINLFNVQTEFPIFPPTPVYISIPFPCSSLTFRGCTHYRYSLSL